MTNKNLKASAYTLLVIAGLLLLCFFISWAPPEAAQQKEEEGMEVNLGDSETGLGDIQPLIPGEPADAEMAVTPEPPPTPAASVNTAIEKEVETNDNDKEAPPTIVKKPIEKPKEKPVTKPVPETPKPVVKPKETIKPIPVPQPTNKPKEEAKPVETPPAPPQPKYVYKGQKQGATGGNNSDSYQASSGQGIAGGKGDQGKINGSPDSDSYTGNGGTGSGSGNGVSIRSGLQGRKINRFPSFQDDFDENAKVAVDIKVDNAGNVVSASIQPKGTTTTNTSMRNIALQKARQLKFNPDENAAEQQIGTIVFNFRVRE
jgi:outer membrane biosynthesis protein TonB